MFSARLLSTYGFAAVLAASAISPAFAQIGIGQGLRVDRPARSIKALRDQDLIKQRLDFSCGAAALATILRYGFGEAVTERDILIQLFALLSDDERVTVRKTGFSLLHLQRVAQARGYTAEGFRLPPDQLSNLGGPVIVFIEPRGYEHFAVLRGVREDRVYLADPSRGNIRMPGYAFLDDWLQDDGTGIIFVVEPKAAPPDSASRLTVPTRGFAQPEIMSVREMLAIGPSLARLHGASR
jgi:predicted double-glycine peptidase